MIEISCEQLERVERILADIPNGAQKAVSNALNRGLSRAKTEAFRRVKQVYTVKPADLAGKTKVSLKTANAGNMTAEITFSGSKIALYKFEVSPKEPGGRYTVMAAVKRGGGGVLPHAFIARMPNSHTGVFERTTKKRYPIKEEMGLSGPEMIGNEEVMDEIEEAAQEVVNQRIEHEVARLLAGYGG